MTETATTRRLFATLAALLLCAAACAGMGLALQRFYRAAYPVHYRQIVLEESERFDLDPALVFAVIRTESGFDADATSNVEARGLMQITQPTFEWAQGRIGETAPLHFDDLYDPETNIRYGAAILRLLLDEFGSEQLAICAYHAGWGTVTRLLEDARYSPDGISVVEIPYPVTAAYVRKVLEAQAAYEMLYRM